MRPQLRPLGICALHDLGYFGADRIVVELGLLRCHPRCFVCAPSWICCKSPALASSWFGTQLAAGKNGRRAPPIYRGLLRDLRDLVKPPSLFHYRLPLVAPVRCGDRCLSFREGLLLRQEVDGQDIWAEAAPLPGFSVESLAEVIHAAQQQAWDAYPSLQFAVASLDGEPLAGKLPVSALLLGESKSEERPIERVGTLPHSTIKLKVGRCAALEQDISRVLAVHRGLRHEQRLRLDANRGWTLDQAIRFARAIADAPIDYWEEPTACPQDFERLFAATGIPYALDETLRETSDLSLFPHVAALIIKPTLMGSCASLIDLASHGIPLVFSSAFESGIGLGHVARLAELYAPQTPVGLDTYRWLAADVRVPRWDMDQGEIDLSVPWHIDPSFLEELSA